MKKVILALSLLLGGLVLSNTSALAAKDIPMTVILEGPQVSIIISQDGHVLSLPAMTDDFMLELRDEYGALTYSVYVPSGTTLIVLPVTLSSDYELRLVADTYYYIGYIVL